MGECTCISPRFQETCDNRNFSYSMFAQLKLQSHGTRAKKDAHEGGYNPSMKTVAWALLVMR
jgi:hypothetical protein